MDSCWKVAEKVIAREKDAWQKKWDSRSTNEEPALARHGQFTEASSAYVGTGYQKNESRCRLLFLSLDPGSGDDVKDIPPTFPVLRRAQDDPCKRTPEAMQKRVVDELWQDLKLGPEQFHFHLGPRGWVHWCGTHLLAAYILHKAAGPPLSGLCEEITRVLKGGGDPISKSKKLAEVTPYFAHSNVVKCSISRLGNRQAPVKMYKNCAVYLKGELEILKPDIIVTQGVDAAKILFDGCTDRVKESDLGDRRVLFFRTHHPAYGRFWTEGLIDDRRWGAYINAAADFMKSRRSL